MALYCVGDVHGDWQSYKSVVDGIRDADPSAVTLQVGDFGVGYSAAKDASIPEFTGPNDRGIYGNHDDHRTGSMFRFFLPRVAWVPSVSLYTISGATTPTLLYPQPTFPEEELGNDDFGRSMVRFARYCPRVVVSHDLPMEAASVLYPRKPMIMSRTRVWLQNHFTAHQPDVWVCGHWHERRDEFIDGCRFVVLEELGTVRLDNVDMQEWSSHPIIDVLND